MIVVNVAAGSPADRAGIEAGDVIVRFADEEIAGIEDLFAALREVSPGDRVEIEVLRDGRRLDLTVVPTDLASR